MRGIRTSTHAVSVASLVIASHCSDQVFTESSMDIPRRDRDRGDPTGLGTLSLIERSGDGQGVRDSLAWSLPTKLPVVEGDHRNSAFVAVPGTAFPLVRPIL
jgi:hypothetical protein